MHEIVDGPNTKKCGPWSTNDNHEIFFGEGKHRRSVFHYRTCMLTYTVTENGEWDGDVDSIWKGTGHGSKSDQGGMNRIFARLSMPFCFRLDRKGGGPRVERLNSPLYQYKITIEV